MLFRIFPHYSDKTRERTRPTRRVVAEKPRYGKKKGKYGLERKVHERIWKSWSFWSHLKLSPEGRGNVKTGLTSSHIIENHIKR